jgi:hypothetical protein
MIQRSRNTPHRSARLVRIWYRHTAVIYLHGHNARRRYYVGTHMHTLAYGICIYLVVEPHDQEQQWQKRRRIAPRRTQISDDGGCGERIV